MSPLSTLRIRNMSIALAIMVFAAPLSFLISFGGGSIYSILGSYGIYVFLLYCIVALVGGIGARLRARRNIPIELTERQVRYANFAGLRQLLVLATNFVLLLVPVATFIIGRAVDQNASTGNPFAGIGTAILLLVVIIPLLAYAAIGAIASLFWLLPASVVQAEQYTITNRLPGRRRILTTRVLNTTLLVLGLLGTGFIASYGLGGMF